MILLFLFCFALSFCEGDNYGVFKDCGTAPFS